MTTLKMKRSIIKQIMDNNKYETTLMDKLIKQEKENTGKTQKTQKTKWATFTYSGKEAKWITRRFKDSSINTSFTTKNTVKRLLTVRQEQNRNQFKDSGVYKLTCPDCHMNYIGQSESSFHTRYSEHLRDYRHNTNKSKFAQHLTENKHSFGPIGETMTVLYKTGKGRLMDTIQRYYIYKETKNNNQINNKITVKPNVIFDMLVQKHTNR
jgi:hypothetical protein